jgi:hypothetical protein
MRTFTNGFTAAKNKKSHQPVNLLKLSWPVIGDFPGKTLNLSDRAVTIDGVDWLPLVDDWGAMAGRGLDSLLKNVSEEKTRVQLVNVPMDFGEGLHRFSDLLSEYPPEVATGILYQWFEGEGLTSTDQIELLTARIVDPVNYDERICSIHLVVESAHHGRLRVGNTVTLADYPDAPESSIGLIRPVVIGQVEDVPGVPVRRVYNTRLTSVALPGAITLDVASTLEFPASGSVVINDDTISYTGTTATQFTGCNGINEFHYAGDEVIESVSDHRYLLSDPAYPVASINNVKVAGELADSAGYFIDLVNGEVVFAEKPRKVVSIDTRFLQSQFNAVAAGNTALDALLATDPSNRTNFASISQVNPKLRLQQTDAMAELGQIQKVLLRVEHWADEKIPNDTMNVRVDGTLAGTLSNPALEDGAATTGTTDIDHTHLDDLGFPVTDPQHEHQLPRLTQYTQEPLTPLLPAGINLNSSNNFKFDITFPSKPAGNIKQIEYFVEHESFGTWSTSNPSISNFLSGHEIFRNNLDGSGSVYTTRFVVTGPIFGDTVSLTTDATVSHSLRRVSRVSRTITYEGAVNLPEEVETRPTGVFTGKLGGVLQHNSSPPLDSITEKSTNSVVNFYDITDQVARDWTWFKDKVVEVEYSGALDGRTVYIIHTAFEIEYARRRLETTDEVTADVVGVKDDGAGTITGVPSAVIERPDHVFRWSIVNLAGLSPTVIDDASFNQAGTEFSNAVTGGYRLAGIVQSKRLLDTLWRQWMKESRSHLYWDAVGKARLQFRLINQSIVAVGSEVKALTESMIRLDPESGAGRIQFQRTPSNEVVNHIELGFQRDWAGGHYRSLHVESDDDAINLFGKREQPDAFLFDWCRDSVMAQNLAQFYLAELKSPQTLIECAVFLDQLELERGDFVTVSHPLISGSSALHGMVLPGDHHFGSGKAGRMDGLDLMIRLFPIEHLRKLLGETAEIADALSTFAAFEVDLPESVAIADAGFIDELDGWGSQDWGTSGWGGLVPL